MGGCLEPPRARNTTGTSPSDHHTDNPSRPPHTPPTNSGGGYVARRSAGESQRTQPAAADSFRSPPPASDKRHASEAGEPRARSLTTCSSPAPGAAASDQEHVRPAPFATAPSYCFTPGERAGEPPSTASANHASPSRTGPNPLASLCGAGAECRRAHVTLAPRESGNRNRPEAGTRVR